MELPIQIFGQRDTRWSRKKLGNSTLTIGSDGCYLCCLAMCFTYWGHEGTPDVYNEIFKAKGCFDKANLNTFAVGDVYGDVNLIERYQCADIPCDISKIDRQLAKLQPVIAWVDNVAGDGKPDHYVVIIGKTEDNHYLTIDPWTGEKYFFDAKWGDPVTKIYGLRIYEGIPKENINYQDKIADLTTQLTSTQSELAKQLERNNVLLADLQQQERDNDSMAKQLTKARTERDQTNWEVSALQGQIKKLDETVTSKDKEITRLKENGNLDKYTTIEILAEAVRRIIKHKKTQ